MIHCCINNCKSVWTKGDIITFHCIPKDKILRKQWLSAIPSNLFNSKNISKHAKICSKHFTSESFALHTFQSPRTRLNKDAVPTLFEEYQLARFEKEILPNMLNMEIDPLDISNENYSHYKMGNLSNVLTREIGVQTLKRSYEDPYVHSLTQCLKRRDKKIKDLEDRLKISEERNNRMKIITDALKVYISEEKRELFLHELWNNSSYKKNYTENIKRFAATIYHYSPKAYKVISKKLTLPHTSTVAKWLIEYNHNP